MCLKLKPTAINLTYVISHLKYLILLLVVKMKLKNDNVRRRGNIHKIKKEQKSYKTEKLKDNSSGNGLKSVYSSLKFEKLVAALHKPVSPRSLGSIRALFGKSQKIKLF